MEEYKHDLNKLESASWLMNKWVLRPMESVVLVWLLLFSICMGCFFPCWWKYEDFILLLKV